MEVIEGVGHFLHVKRPRAVNERILASTVASAGARVKRRVQGCQG